jgi:hypothetical protein
MGKHIHRIRRVDTKRQMGDCIACGWVRVVQRKPGGSWRCYPSKKELRKRSKRRFAQAYQEGLVAHIKAGGCVICGYVKCMKALDFHHVNSREKVTTIGSHMEFPLRPQIVREIPKCILVCANCHREIHAGIFGQEFIKSLPRAKAPGRELSGRK